MYRPGARAPQRMKRRDPELAAVLYEYLARVLAERLAATNRLLQAVLD